MKKRISVYIDEGFCETAKIEARRLSVEVNADISASEVVEDAIKAFCGVEKVPPVKKDEFKTDVSDAVPEGEVHVIDDSGNKVAEIKNLDKTEAQILAEGQAKLDATRKDRDIKKEQVARSKEKLAKGPVTGLMGHSGPLSKASQVGKKK